MNLNILSLEGKILNENNVDSIDLETLDGPISILKNHTSLITLLKIGILSYRKKIDIKKNFVVIGSNGFAEVYKNRITIIVDTAEKKEDIDINRAKKAKEIYEKLHEENIKKTKDGALVENQLRKAKARIKCFEKDF